MPHKNIWLAALGMIVFLTNPLIVFANPSSHSSDILASEPTSSFPQYTSPRSQLINQRWQLVSINGQAVSADTHMWIEFGEDLSLYGSDGCNPYEGRYRTVDNHIGLSFARQSRLLGLCLAASEDRSQLFHSEAVEYVLRRARRFSIQGSQLTFSSRYGNLAYEAIPAEIE